MLKRFLLWCRNISRINNAYRHANELFGKFNDRLQYLESDDVQLARQIASNMAVDEVHRAVAPMQLRVAVLTRQVDMLELAALKPKGRPVKKGRAK